MVTIKGITRLPPQEIVDMGDDFWDNTWFFRGIESHKKQKSLRKKVDMVISAKQASGEFIIFDKFGNPVSKIEKQVAAFDVMSSYFSKMPNSPIRTLDLRSSSGIWGWLLAKKLGNTVTVDIAIDSGIEDPNGTYKMIEANELGNVEIIDRNNLWNDYGLIIIDHAWGGNATTLYNEIIDLLPKVGSTGKLLLVSHKNQGIETVCDVLNSKWVRNTIVGRWRGGVRLVEIYPDKEKREKIDTRKGISFSFGAKEYSALVDTWVFSKEGLDEGTRFLLEEVLRSKINLNNKVVGDIGTGWGSIPIVLLEENAQTKYVWYEIDKVSHDVTNANLLKFSDRVKLFHSNMASDKPNGIEGIQGKIDIFISNPPFHVSEKERELIFMNVRKLLKKGGDFLFVVENSFAERFNETAGKYFSVVEKKTNEKYQVAHCKRT